jgi:hypothetical protein
MTLGDINAAINLIRNKDAYQYKSAHHYKVMRECAVLKVGDEYSLVRKRDVEGREFISVENLPRYLAYEDLYDGIRQCHVELNGHAGIRRTEKAAQRHYVNVSRVMIDKFVAGCSCQLDRKFPSKPEDIKPIISSSFNSRGQVDLINMTAYPDGKMSWILHYQDHHDKMSYLRALPNKNATTACNRVHRQSYNQTMERSLLQKSLGS